MIARFQSDTSRDANEWVDTNITPPPVSTIQTQKEKAFENELAAQMAVLATRYEENIRFPNYSVPITRGQTDLLQPLQVLPVQLNLGPDADSTAYLAPDQYIFFHGDSLTATLKTSGPTKATHVRIELVENNNSIARFHVKEKDQTFTASLEHSSSQWPVNLHIRAQFKFGEHGDLSILSPIKYSPDNGSITSVGESYIDGANLAIPVTLDIKQAGRYRLAVNFFDETGSPLAHLNAKQNLNIGSNQWILNVHSEVLRAAAQPGPYYVDTWTLTKLPERPGIKTSYGSSAVGKVVVKGFPLEEYDDTPWEDPKDKARLEFLKKLQ